MKIQYISGSSFPSEISHTLSKMRMCQALSDAGHDVLFTALDAVHKKAPNEFYDLKGDFKIALQKMNLFMNNRLTRKLRVSNLFNGLYHSKKIKHFQPDIIYSRLTVIELLFVPRYIPIIYEMHSLGPFGKGLIFKTLFKFVLKIKNFKRIIVSSNTLLEMLKEHVNDIEIIVARLSAEEPVEASQNEINDFKKENIKGQNLDYHVGYTGYLDTVGLRGTDIICRTAQQMPNTAFHIVGGKPEILEYWVNYAKDWNQNQNIFFYGHRNQSHIPFFLRCFDVVLAPLQYKPVSRAPTGANMSPLKLPQYMAYKKAMVVSDLVAHKEILDHDRTALLVKSDDIDAWKVNIEKLLSSPEKSTQMGENAFSEYLKNFTPQRRVEKILDNIDV